MAAPLCPPRTRQKTLRYPKYYSVPFPRKAAACSIRWVHITPCGSQTQGTGHGAFTFIASEEGELLFIYIDPRWPEEILKHLRSDILSMPAGESIGAVVFADYLAETLVGLTHLVIFSDCVALVAAIQSSSSESPQLNFIVNWLFQRHPQVQFMALHQPGKRNAAADGLSRSSSASVIAEAQAAGARAIQLEQQQHAIDLMFAAADMPQRAPPPRSSQEKGK